MAASIFKTTSSLFVPRLCQEFGSIGSWRRRAFHNPRVGYGRFFSSASSQSERKKDENSGSSSAVSPNLMETSLKGVGQVILLNSTTSGMAILGGLALGDPYLSILAATGTVTATAAARGAGLEKSMLNDGLWGYNGCLVGCATAVFMYPMAPAIAATSAPLILKAGMGGLITTVMGASTTPFVAAALKSACGSVPQFTLAFNVVTLTTLLRTRPLLYPASSSENTEAAAASAGSLDRYVDILLQAPLKGISQIFVVESCLSGTIILGGIAMYSRGLAAHTFLGSCIGAATGLLFGADPSSIQIGLWGFNSALTSLAVGVFFVHSPQVIALSAGGAAASAALFGAMESIFTPFGSPCLTLPFCITMSGCYLLRDTMPGLKIAESPHSPEKNI